MEMIFNFQYFKFYINIYIYSYSVSAQHYRSSGSTKNMSSSRTLHPLLHTNRMSATACVATPISNWNEKYMSSLYVCNSYINVLVYVYVYKSGELFNWIPFIFDYYFGFCVLKMPHVLLCEI